MASGNTLVTFFPADNEPPATAFATLDIRNGHLVLGFDDTAVNEDAIFTGVLPRHYAGGGITITLIWMATSATTGNVIWQTSIERIDTATDLDADSFATAVTAAAAAANATNGIPTYTTNAHTNGAQMDNLAVGEAFRLKVQRLGSNASDTMTGDAELIAVEIRET